MAYTKIVGFILFIFLSITFVPGGTMFAEKVEMGQGDPPLYMMSGEHETRIAVRQAGDFLIKIKSNPTTGYSWALLKPVDEKILKFKGLKEEDDQEIEQPLIGQPTYEIFVLEALAPGKTTVELQYRRPWEKDVPPIKTYKIHIIIE